jgi:hypothetical protein
MGLLSWKNIGEILHQKYLIIFSDPQEVQLARCSLRLLFWSIYWSKAPRKVCLG